MLLKRVPVVVPDSDVMLAGHDWDLAHLAGCPQARTEERSRLAFPAGCYSMRPTVGGGQMQQSATWSAFPQPLGRTLTG